MNLLIINFIITRTNIFLEINRIDNLHTFSINNFTNEHHDLLKDYFHLLMMMMMIIILDFKN